MLSEAWRTGLLLVGWLAIVLASRCPTEVYGQPAPTEPGSNQGSTNGRFVVMTFNVGTTRGLSHDDPPEDGYGAAQAESSDCWYGNGLAWRPAVSAVRQMIAEVDPDIVALQEVFDCSRCAEIPPDQQKGFVCEGWSSGDASVPRQVLGSDYQIAYHPGKRSKCLAVHRRFGKLRRGPATDDLLEGFPIAGCGSGARVARGIVDRAGGSQWTVISIHGTSGLSPADQQCRVRQVERIFVDFGDGAPGVRGPRNLILGDFNTDPWRARGFDASANRWDEFVGRGRPFRFLSRVGPNAPRAYRGFADIDHVVSDSLQGSCRCIGVDDGTTPVWEGTYFDHVPIVCTLTE